jgi:hypothetical protein
MDKANHFRTIIEQVLTAHTKAPPSIGEVQFQAVFDRDHDHYLLVQVGWGPQKRIYGTIAHIDLVGDKLWIQYDGIEEGVANQLRDVGIPADHIILGYRIPEVRRQTGYAVA